MAPDGHRTEPWVGKATVGCATKPLHIEAQEPAFIERGYFLGIGETGQVVVCKNGKLDKMLSPGWIHLECQEVNQEGWSHCLGHATGIFGCGVTNEETPE